MYLGYFLKIKEFEKFSESAHQCTALKLNVLSLVVYVIIWYPKL